MLNGGLSETYPYDAVGNRLSSLGVSPYVYNESNQLSSTPRAGFSYDANGNTLSKTEGGGTTNYTWDFENRLTSISLPGGGVVSFQYDPFGRRIRKVSASGTGVYVYDGDNQIEELNASGGVVARYTQGLGIDEPLALYRSGRKYYYHADGLGSIVAMTDNHGTPKASHTYDAFGNDSPPEPPPPPSSITNPFRYTGRELDSETGLYYYRARYYDPTTGQFLSEDPIRFEAGPNFFRYVDDDPINKIDPFGTQAKRGGGCGCTSWSASFPTGRGDKGVFPIAGAGDLCKGTAEPYLIRSFQCEGGEGSNKPGGCCDVEKGKFKASCQAHGGHMVDSRSGTYSYAVCCSKTRPRSPYPGQPAPPAWYPPAK